MQLKNLNDFVIQPIKVKILNLSLHNFQGTLKGLLPQQLEQLDCQIILGNTYHLGNRPVRNHALSLEKNINLDKTVLSKT